MDFNLEDCLFLGPALPEPFVKFHLPAHLAKAKLLPDLKGPKGKEMQKRWEAHRRKLKELGDEGGSIRVKNHVLEPLVADLGYETLEKAEEVTTREGEESGGWLFEKEGARLRAWSVDVGTDLDAPSRRGRAYRFSPTRIAVRVLQTLQERVGLLTDGTELRILICDPARPDSYISIALDRARGWRSRREVPDSFRLLVALTSPRGVAQVPRLTDEARLNQSQVTKELRSQARAAVEGFLQEVLDDPRNREALAAHSDTGALARELWREGLILVYRLLFVLKLESSPDLARA
ncbi:MAG: hypothetical protein HY815_31365, partial [Candidatus Riflebacteria bacterium]|nr:hypothetical protein [Candidatus Riflebacteria bacterium]